MMGHTATGMQRVRGTIGKYQGGEGSLIWRAVPWGSRPK